VNIKVPPDGEFERYEDITIWNGNEVPIPEVVQLHLESPDKVVVRPADLRIPFKKFMELLYSPNFTGNFYLEYTSIPSSIPTMMNDIEPIPFASFFNTELTNIWLGNGKTVGKLHFDPFDNLLCQISGHKRFIIFEPHHNEDLYEGHIREAQWEFTLSTQLFERKHLMQSTSMVMSPVDIKKPNYERYPLFRNTKAFNCTVGPGEILFLPSYWWHEVASVPDEFHRNIAVNYWYTPFYDKEFPCKNCRLFVNPHYYNLKDSFL